MKFIKLFITVLLLALSNLVGARTIKVAVIDTGFDFNSTWPTAKELGLSKPKLCSTGHKDFTNTTINDNHNHGTHIAGIIAKGLDNVDYCLIIIKYYDPKNISNTLENSINSFKWAIDQKVDIINYSGGGVIPYEKEREIVLKAIKLGIIFVAAAGNERSDVSRHPFYPASYSPLVESVGNLKPNGQVASSSNHGKAIRAFRMGTNVLSLLPNNKYGTMSGTSQASGVRSNELVKELYKVQKFCTSKAIKVLKPVKQTKACNMHQSTSEVNMNQIQTKIKKLMQEREKLCFQMIEASGAELLELEQELQELESEIEVGSGRTIDELEVQLYNGDH